MGSVQMVQRNAHGMAPVRESRGQARTLLRSIAGQVAVMFQRVRQRRALAKLTPHLLRDIGITPEQAREEIGKPFWRA